MHLQFWYFKIIVINTIILIIIAKCVVHLYIIAANVFYTRIFSFRFIIVIIILYSQM